MCRHHKASALPESVEQTHSEKRSPSLSGQSCSSLTPLENSDLNLKRKMASSRKASRKHKNSIHLLLGSHCAQCHSPHQRGRAQWRPDSIVRQLAASRQHDEGKPSLHTKMVLLSGLVKESARMCVKHTAQGKSRVQVGGS